MRGPVTASERDLRTLAGIVSDDRGEPPAEGLAPSSRLARRSRRDHPMPAAARRYPAGLQTPGSRPGSLPGNQLSRGGLSEDDHRARDEHGHEGHAPDGDG